MLVPPWYELPPPGYGGLEQMCAALVDSLVTRGHDVTVIGAGTRSGTSGKFVSTIDEPQHLRLGEGLPELVHVGRANRLLEEGDFDVVHDHTCAGLLTAGTRSAPTVATVHNKATGEHGDLLTCLGQSVSLVAISNAQQQSRPELPWVATVHNGLSTDQLAKFVPDGRRPADRPVLWLARFSPDKGPDQAIDACRAAGLPLVLAGKCTEPSERRYLSEVIAPMLGPDTELVLNADRRRSQSLIRSARCLIMPIRWHEPFGMVMVEAMAEGTPVVALNRGAVPEVVQHGVTGLICEDLAALPEALMQVTTVDPYACIRHVQRWFSAELMASRYEQVYRKVIRNSLVSRPLTFSGLSAPAGTPSIA
jgi:glycosyltransferase involved in cell wall biosynthesis